MINTAQLLQFLQQLQQNNNKAWMDTHKTAYQVARHTLLEITNLLIRGIGKVDNDIASLNPTNCIFRINRDIRFSKDKSPYKNNMGVYLSKGGKNEVYAGYYLHLQPLDQSFIAGGLYQPSPTVLRQIRQEIDYDGTTLERIVADKKFNTLFGTLQGEKLKRPPKGYDEQHPHIDWLKLKSFTALHPVIDATVLQTNFVDYIVEVFKALLPLNQFLNATLVTNDVD